MGIFDSLFGGSLADELKQNLKDAGRMSTIDLGSTYKEQDMSKDAIYMVGMNEDGFTQLRVGYPTSITLTLNADGVAQLIKQLAVNIDEDYTVKVTRITYEDEE